MTEAEFEEITGWLGHPFSVLRASMALNSAQVAVGMLPLWKADLKRAAKKFVFDNHPDRSDAPDGEARIKRLHAALEQLDGIRVRVQRPPPRRAFVYVVAGTNFSTSSTTSFTGR